MAMEPAEEETSEDVEDERERNSKIRARQSTRNRLLYKHSMADGRASATREQEAFLRFPTDTPRPDPVSFRIWQSRAP